MVQKRRINARPDDGLAIQFGPPITELKLLEDGDRSDNLEPPSDQEFVSHVAWTVRRAEQIGNVLEHDRPTRLAVALVLNRLDWLQENGSDDFAEARNDLSAPMLKAVDAIIALRTQEAALFDDVFKKHGIDKVYQRRVIDGVDVALNLGTLELQNIATRSKNYQKRRDRERSAVAKLITLLESEDTTPHFKHACANQGLTVKRLSATIGLVDFWAKHESRRSARSGGVQDIARLEVVRFLKTFWESLGRTASAAYRAEFSDRQTAFVIFVEDCLRAVGKIGPHASIDSSIANDLDKLKT